MGVGECGNLVKKVKKGCKLWGKFLCSLFIFPYLFIFPNNFIEKTSQLIIQQILIFTQLKLDKFQVGHFSNWHILSMINFVIMLDKIISHF